ncbi:MAG: hypothetical protein AB7Y46_09150 [Armatimonadota bacterium]
MINRAPVLTLWGAVVAERLGFEREEALTLGRALAGLNAQAKGRALGIFGPPKAVERDGMPRKTGLGEDLWVELCGRSVPAQHTTAGIRACVKNQPIEAEKVQSYLRSKFGEHLQAVREAMEALASAYEPEELRERAYGLYEQFRPQIPRGKSGWGREGVLDLELIRSLSSR